MAMLQEAAKQERYTEERSKHPSYRVLVKVNKWEILL